ncbi:MAG: oligosaccharide flippase family protein [Thermoplasmataceae archaeon]
MGGANDGHYLGIDAVFQYSGAGAQMVSGSIFYLIAVRMFSTTTVGAIVMFVAIVGLFNTIFSFGLGSAAQHFTSYSIGKGDYSSVKKTVYTIIFYGFTLAIGGFISLFILSPEISLIFLHTTQYTTLIRLLGFVVLGNILFGVMNGALLGSQNFRLSAMISIVIWVIYYIGAIGLAIIFRSLDTVVIGWAFGIFAGVIIELFAIIHIMGKYETTGYKKNSNAIFAFSLPVLFSSLISYGAGYADRFVVTGLTNLSNLGIYNFALLIGSSIGLIAAPFNSILMPKFSELFGQNRRSEIAGNVKASSLLLTSIYVPAAIGIASLAPSILSLLGGNLSYDGGSGALIIIMFFSALFVNQNILSQAIASVRRTKLFLYTSVAALIVNVFFSILLIPSFGLDGAALGFSSVYAISFITLYYFARKENIVKFDISGTVKVWASSLTMMLSLILMQIYIGVSIFYLPAYILIGGIIYIGISKIIGIFKNENKTMVLALFPERLKLFRKFISVLILH